MSNRSTLNEFAVFSATASERIVPVAGAGTCTSDSVSLTAPLAGEMYCAIDPVPMLAAPMSATISFDPIAPCGPVSPVRPVPPVSPWAPVAPVVPSSPVAPFAPTAPGA
jgi:hypothetical protein